jgi:hypothetical protein
MEKLVDQNMEKWMDKKMEVEHKMENLINKKMG